MSESFLLEVKAAAERCGGGTSLGVAVVINK